MPRAPGRGGTVLLLRRTRARSAPHTRALNVYQALASWQAGKLASHACARRMHILAWRDAVCALARGTQTRIEADLATCSAAELKVPQLPQCH